MFALRSDIETEEWGNPKEKVYYDYIKSYSPVDNLRAARYPNVLVTAGLDDSRVGYWVSLEEGIVVMAICIEGCCTHCVSGFPFGHLH